MRASRPNPKTLFSLAPVAGEVWEDKAQPVEASHTPAILAPTGIFLRLSGHPDSEHLDDA